MDHRSIIVMGIVGFFTIMLLSGAAQASGGIGYIAFFAIVLINCVFLMGTIVWALNVRGRKIVSQMEDRVENCKDFDAADLYIGQNYAGVAIDRKRRRILLIDRDDLRIFDVGSILSCEVLEDGVQLAYANRGSQLLGVAVGGALLGGVGAVIGGLSGSQRTIQRVQSIVLRFTTDDFDKPVHDIVVDEAADEKGMGKGSVGYRRAIEVASLWHGRTVAMMKGA